MPIDEQARARLPDRASSEHLRKQAKRLAKAEGLKLGHAQRRLAHDHGFPNWAAMMRAVDARAAPQTSPLSQAAARGDAETVARLLGEGAAVDCDGERNTPLFLACDSEAPAHGRIAAAKLLIEAGAFTRAFCEGGATPLHAAARRGPAAMVELLLRSGGLVWQGDDRGKRPFDYAEAGTPIGRERILFLTADGPRIDDPIFRDAVAAIQAGDAAGLAALLDAHPRLLRERAIEPDIGPRGYFTDPKLFWFIANNPTLVDRSPANIVEIAELMIARGVEREDLDYALELVATNAQMAPAEQIALVRVLTGAGARMRYKAMLMSLGHQQAPLVAWLLDHGLEPSAASLAGLGRMEALPATLASASAEEKADALSMAVINRESEAARLCLEAGADPNLFMACHSHSTPLHQAALHGDLALMKLLVDHGARTDVEDTLWRGTPLGWALHGGKTEAADWLRSLA